MVILWRLSAWSPVQHLGIMAIDFVSLLAFHAHSFSILYKGAHALINYFAVVTVCTCHNHLKCSISRTVTFSLHPVSLSCAPRWSVMVLKGWPDHTPCTSLVKEYCMQRITVGLHSIVSEWILLRWTFKSKLNITNGLIGTALCSVSINIGVYLLETKHRSRNLFPGWLQFSWY